MVAIPPVRQPARECARSARTYGAGITPVNVSRDAEISDIGTADRRRPAPGSGGDARSLNMRRFLTDSRKALHNCVVHAVFNAEPLLRGAALRVTRPRVAVLTAVHEHPHADADSVIRLVRRDMSGVSKQGVYDVLRALAAVGLVRRIAPAGSVARYESRVGDNHHHAVCRSCGAITDVDCAVGHAPCLTASDGRDFAVDEAEVVYWGTCPACAANRTSQ
jgi:Fe2+ or Zn2+ uptake regulation protein